MRPFRIHYVTTSDHVRIAYCDEGAGEPVLVTELVMASLTSKHEGVFQKILSPMAQRFRVIHFDGRGMGSSTRNAEDLSLDARVLDIEAVAAAAGLDSFAIVGNQAGCLSAVAFAAKHPSRVSSMTLIAPYASAEEHYRLSRTAMPGLLAERDFPFVLEIMGRASGFNSEETQRWVEVAQKAVTPAEYARWRDATALIDVTPLLALVQCPTLVLDVGATHSSLVEHLASLIPVASLQSLERSPDLWSTVAALVADFPGPAPEPAHEGIGEGGLRTILFTDIESSTALTQQVGDEGAQEVLRRHNAAVRKALEEHGGREVKHTGDGIMASFPSAVAAVTAAHRIQRDLAGDEIRVRIGINAGEPIAEDHDFFGTAAQLAARITARAEPGQVLVSDVVRQLCSGKAFEFVPIGAVTLKGFAAPVSLFVADPR